MTLEVREICKRYGSLQAVDRVSFSATGGRIFGLLGPNGAGKTTTIRMIMNIIAPDSGSILFDGLPMRSQDKDRIGYLPEERGLYRKMLVNDLLLYFASLKGLSRPRAQRAAEAWLDRLGLRDWQRRKVQELSKGMSQKVQFIVAVLHAPQVLFLDEPFAGLDPVSTESLRAAVLELAASGTAVVLSTHIMEQAERMCHEILILDKGREALRGPLAEVKARFGRNSVVVEFDGDVRLVQESPQVANLISYPRWVEAELLPGADPDELLRSLAGRLSIRRFEVVAPSLHKIFVSKVGDEAGRR